MKDTVDKIGLLNVVLSIVLLGICIANFVTVISKKENNRVENHEETNYIYAPVDYKIKLNDTPENSMWEFTNDLETTDKVIVGTVSDANSNIFDAINIGII